MSSDQERAALAEMAKLFVCVTDPPYGKSLHNIVIAVDRILGFSYLKYLHSRTDLSLHGAENDHAIAGVRWHRICR